MYIARFANVEAALEFFTRRFSLIKEFVVRKDNVTLNFNSECAR